MPRKKTREELESEIARLRATEEAYTALRLAVMGAGYWGPGVRLLCSGEGETFRSIEIVGLDRAAGGVVICVDGLPCAPMYLCDWCQRIEAQGNADVYMLDVARQARRAQVEAIQTRGEPYVGKTFSGEYRVFRSDVTPTEETHPDFRIVIGPFKTVRGASYWTGVANRFGTIITQDDAETCARRLETGR